MMDQERDLSREDITPEQEDEDTQAQTVADEALDGVDERSPLDSVKDDSGLEDVDAPDLIDRMKQMESSGNIDMAAFDGEETMDDLENRYGSRNAADEEFAGDDS
ncbi:hypothetical protein GGR39_000594 [Novosphingobium fluoreni]|uniref:Uncharacterized protein n=1 Tax=Novosphingobium fluoreni TaxID=1391222 RepID=A0A7W6C1Z1_9SPHN|nr:hypothetical protein [Novosphingobium fluoreni]MBB3938965.1 hypothetical protein [Novosphingobium fluoreni]